MATALLYFYWVIWYTSFPATEALGLPSTRMAALYTGISLAALAVLMLLYLAARRVLTLEGSVSLQDDSIEGDVNKHRFRESLADLQAIRVGFWGANIRLNFRPDEVQLIGLWLPPDWRYTLLGVRKPDGSRWRGGRKTHPFLLQLASLRPGLPIRFRPGMVAWGWLVPFLLLQLLIAGSQRPLFEAAQSAMHSYEVDEQVLGSFRRQEYAEACKAYPNMIPDLAHSLYPSENAAQLEIYCGDLKSAIRAAVGFKGQPLWPAPFDQTILANIRIAQGRPSQAEALLAESVGGGYMQYVALARQGKRAQADQILAQDDRPSGSVGVFDRALLLRHQGQVEDSHREARLIWSNLSRCDVQIPRHLEKPILAGFLTEDTATIQEAIRRYGKALRELPGLRREVAEFLMDEGLDSDGYLRSQILDPGESSRGGPAAVR